MSNKLLFILLGLVLFFMAIAIISESRMINLTEKTEQALIQIRRDILDMDKACQKKIEALPKPKELKKRWYRIN